MSLRIIARVGRNVISAAATPLCVLLLQMKCSFRRERERGWSLLAAARHSTCPFFVAPT